MTEAKSAPNERLRYERIRRGWSQQDLADKIGTTPLNVGRWERGITIPGPYLRQNLCEVYEKSPPELGLVVPASMETARPSAVEVNGSAVAPAPEAPTTLWNVPYGRNLLFTGREDILAHLRDILLRGEHPVALAQPQAISGLGGIGKTQTAIEYAHRYRESYEAVFWARADSADLLTSDFLLIAALLNLPQRNEQDQSVVIKAVLRWFDTQERWLLILDNADLLEMVSEFMPPAGKGHVLLTTRANSTGTIAQRIEIEKMGLDEGMLFLLRRMKRLKGNAGLESIPEALRSQAQAIVEAVDGLPLALDQAGAYIEETGCTLSDYLKFYKTRHTRLLRMRGASATGHPEPVATTWSLSFEKVERANPAAAELLRLCAFLHPDEIPEAMIIEGASELGPILQPVAEDELDWNEAIGELRKYSLVKRDSEEKILNIHRLVQAVIKDGMDKETQREWAERTVCMVSRSYPNPEVVDMWPKCQLYLSHAQICTQYIKNWDIDISEAAQLLNNMGNYLNERGLYAEAKFNLQQALDIREKIFGLNHLAVAQSLIKLAYVYFAQSEYENAISLLQRSLIIREQTLGSTHPDVAENLNDLAVLYNNQARYEESEPLFLRAIAIREQRLGSSHPDLVANFHNLARLYADQGKYEQAEALYRRALSIGEQKLGFAHPGVMQCMNSLSMLYKAQSKYEQAISLLQQCLATFEPILGSTHPDIARILNNLALLYRIQGRYEEADLLYQRALIIWEQTLGAVHPSVADCLSNIARLYQDQRKYEQAETFYLRALTIREQTQGQDHPSMAHTFNNLAMLYHVQSKYGQAEPLYLRSLAIREQALGSEHPDVAVTLENYANLLHETNREAQATELKARAQSIRAKQQ